MELYQPWWKPYGDSQHQELSDELYEKVRELARRERRSIGKQVIHLLTQALEGEKTHSILELCGLGKEIWEGIDPAAYIREERDSWDS